MCDLLYIEDRDEYIQTEGELAAFVGSAAGLVYHGAYGDSEFDAGCCICSVDLKRTLAPLGYKVHKGYGRLWAKYGADVVARKPATRSDPPEKGSVSGEAGA